MPPKIIKLAQLIAQYEGCGPKDRATRNKNPGNCRFYSGGYLKKYGNVTCDKDGFAVFPSMSQGWLYLENMLLNWAKTTRADWTILQLMKSYAPTADGNNPVAYAAYLRRYLAVGQDTKLKDLLT